jgi:hypothetical protein
MTTKKELNDKIMDIDNRMSDLSIKIKKIDAELLSMKISKLLVDL